MVTALPITESAIVFNPLSRRHTRHDPVLDGWRRYLTDSPTLSSIASQMKNVDAGDLSAMIEMCEEMEGKDGHLQNVASRRREALTALDWEIVPDPDWKNQSESQEVAEFCKRRLNSLPAWPFALDHLAEAIGPGLSVLELIWRRGRLVDIICVPGTRLQGNFVDGSGVYVETEEEMMPGVKAERPKWVVHAPQSRGGAPMRVSIGRAQAYLWILKHFAIADWSSFTEVYGQPMRIGKMLEGASPEDGEKAQDMLENMASDCWGLFGDKVDIQLLEAARTNQPFEGLVDWCERKQSILWLGQTLTTEQESTGSLALGRVHANVRTSITVSDMQKEKRTIREGILRPMTFFRWPERDVPVPHFQRKIVEEAQLDSERLQLDKLRFMKENGYPVDKEYVYDSLKIPRPKEPGELPGEPEPGAEG